MYMYIHLSYTKFQRSLESLLFYVNDNPKLCIYIVFEQYTLTNHLVSLV